MTATTATRYPHLSDTCPGHAALESDDNPEGFCDLRRCTDPDCDLELLIGPHAIHKGTG